MGSIGPQVSSNGNVSSINRLRIVCACNKSVKFHKWSFLRLNKSNLLPLSMKLLNSVSDQYQKPNEQIYSSGSDSHYVWRYILHFFCFWLCLLLLSWIKIRLWALWPQVDLFIRRVFTKNDAIKIGVHWTPTDGKTCMDFFGRQLVKEERNNTFKFHTKQWVETTSGGDTRWTTYL